MRWAAILRKPTARGNHAQRLRKNVRLAFPHACEFNALQTIDSAVFANRAFTTLREEVREAGQAAQLADSKEQGASHGSGNGGLNTAEHVGLRNKGVSRQPMRMLSLGREYTPGLYLQITDATIGSLGRFAEVRLKQRGAQVHVPIRPPMVRSADSQRCD
jgi:hypothetical protein